MAVDSSLKIFLKTLKERETIISMVLGAIVVIIAAAVLVNAAKQNRPNINGVTDENEPTPVQTQELQSTEIASQLPSITPESIEVVVLTPEPTLSPTQPHSLLKQASQFVLNLLGQNKSGGETTDTVPPVKEGNYTLTLVRQANGSIMPQNLPSKHTVIAGESLWKIAETYYGSGYNWVDIAKANGELKSQKIEAGEELQLPNVRVRVPKNGNLLAKVQDQPPVATTNVLAGGTYTIQKGDSLWTIAVKEYNDGFMWTRIASANSDKIKNPGIIEVGWELQIPSK
jgi:nucleoid-associated protein YgaU